MIYIVKNIPNVLGETVDYATECDTGSSVNQRQMSRSQ